MASRLSFVVKRDKNADIERRFIMSVKIDGKCVRAPRFMFLEDALDEVPDYMEEYDESETIIEVKI